MASIGGGVIGGLCDTEGEMVITNTATQQQTGLSCLSYHRSVIYSFFRGEGSIVKVCQYLSW